MLHHRMAWLALPLAMGLGACSLTLDDPSSLVVYSDPSITDALHQFPSAQSARFELSPNDLAAVTDQADGDVFVFADEHSARAAERAGLVEDVTRFAMNTLVLVVPSGSDINDISDLANAKVAVCAEPYACGQAGKALLKRYAPKAQASTYDEGSAAAVTAVLSGDADAAIVYATDTMELSGRVTTSSLPQVGNAPEYFVALSAKSKRKSEGRAFIESTLDTVAYAVLSAGGFER